MLRLSFLFTLFSCLWTPSQAAPSPESRPTLTIRNAPPLSTACGDIVRNGSVNTFKASFVYDCLTSVPFNPAVASRFMKYYRDSIQFQSTLAYLKNPPPSYQQLPVDLLAGLDEIQGQIDTGLFKNQYEFEATLQKLIYSAHDDHLTLAAGILGIFSFGTSYRIASVSKDGIELPKPYLTADLILSAKDGNWSASPIITLDGQDVTEYLSGFASANAIGGRESHTDWNQLMINPAQVIQSIPSIWGGGATFYPGENLVIGLKNGTNITTPWYGIFHGDSETGPLETGGDFYNSFVLGWWPESYDPEETEVEEGSSDEGSATVVSQSTTPTSTKAAAPSNWKNGAYPTPDLAQEDLGMYGGGFLSGYFLKEDSIAVLSMPSFQEYGDAIDTYSSFVTEFISTSKAKGMKKVVIDLQRNYGGDALLATDTFRQFFPGIDPFAGSRLRAHTPANVMGKTLTNYFKKLNPKDEFEIQDYTYLYSNEWIAPTRLDAETNKTFASWEQFFGPHLKNGDNFTTTQRYNLADPLFDTLALEAYNDGFVVYGYGSRPAEENQPWAAEDVILLTDGICSSTCSLFVEMMHHEAGVKTVVAGGRPSYGPMQAVGLTRGARSYRITTKLDSDITDTQTILQYYEQPFDFLPNRTEALEVEVVYSSINLRDQVRKDDDTPLQFTYDAADCRIFFTPETIFSLEALWKYAADAIWTKPELCVKDSTGYARTNASDTKLPPATVLPAASAVETPDIKLGAVIHNIFAPESGIEAGANVKGGTANTNAIPLLAPDCSKDPGDSSYCPVNTYCDRNYQFCSKAPKTLNLKLGRPGCVRRCPHYGTNYYCSAALGGGICRPLPEDVETQLDSTGRGYCSPLVKQLDFSCSNTATAFAVNPGGAGRPTRRDESELVE